MSSLFIVMQGGSSPIAIVIPTPKAVFSSRKEANEFIKSKRYPHEWYVRRVESHLREKDQ